MAPAARQPTPSHPHPMPTPVRFAAIIPAIAYAVLAASFPLPKAVAAPGALDTTFGAAGSNGTGQDEHRERR
jgi:hypothetical protein